jgi:hypothetical protein
MPLEQVASGIEWIAAVLVVPKIASSPRACPPGPLVADRLAQTGDMTAHHEGNQTQRCRS